MEARSSGRGHRYGLTEAGKEFQSIIEGLGVWGQRWTVRVDRKNLDPGFLLWNMRRRIALVIDDLVLLELAKRHVARELLTIGLGQNVDRKDVGERPGDPAKFFDLHERESLGATSSGPAGAGAPAPGPRCDGALR